MKRQWKAKQRQGRTLAPPSDAAIPASPEPQPSSSTATTASPGGGASQQPRPPGSSASSKSAVKTEVPQTYSQRSHCCLARDLKAVKRQ